MAFYPSTPAAGGQLCSFHSWIFWITLPVTFCARCGCGYVCFSFSGIYLGVELLASVVDSMFTLLRNCQAVCPSVHQTGGLSHPTNGGNEIPLSSYSPVLIICAARQMEVSIWLWFWFAFPWRLWCWVSFYILIGPLYIFFGEMPVRMVTHLKILGCLFINEL